MRRTHEEQQALNQKHFDTPVPGDLWRERFQPTLAILEALPDGGVIVGCIDYDVNWEITVSAEHVCKLSRDDFAADVKYSTGGWLGDVTPDRLGNLSTQYAENKAAGILTFHEGPNLKVLRDKKEQEKRDQHYNAMQLRHDMRLKSAVETLQSMGYAYDGKTWVREPDRPIELDLINRAIDDTSKPELKEELRALFKRVSGYSR